MNHAQTISHKQIEKSIRYAMDEKSIKKARPMSDAEINMLRGILQRNSKAQEESKFIQIIVEMINLVTDPPLSLPDKAYLHCARKMLRRFYELFLVLQESRPSSNTTLH